MYILVRYILLQMARRWQTLPFFRPDHVQLVRPRLAETSASCPPDLFRELAANNLVPDEQTARDGNCGIDAFARSLLAQMQNGQGATCRTESARRRRDLHKARDKIDWLRKVGVQWLEANSGEVIWPGMTVAKLCCTVSGLSFQEYLGKCGSTKNGSTQHLCMRWGGHTVSTC